MEFPAAPFEAERRRKPYFYKIKIKSEAGFGKALNSRVPPPETYKIFGMP